MNTIVKRVIVVRKDLGMRKGKMMAQVSHASKLTLLEFASIEGERLSIDLNQYGKHTQAIISWLQGDFTEVVVSVDSKEAFDELVSKAKSRELPVFVVTDLGKTEFNGVPTETVVSIGPAESSHFDGVTDGLKLL